MIKIVFVALLSVISVYAENEAIVVLQSNEPNVKGTINFIQEGDAVRIEGYVDGLTPGKHGFHVHAKGDLSNGCASAGSHFNPFNQTHGAPDAAVRHVGDLGNIVADDKGHAAINISDKLISLKNGVTNILGRAVVVHTGEDDLGLTDHPDSKTTGNAGGRIACGIIGILSDEWNSSGSIKSPTALFVMILLACSLFISGRAH